MKNFFYGVLVTLCIGGIIGYYFYNRTVIENLEYIQKQQEMENIIIQQKEEIENLKFVQQQQIENNNIKQQEIENTIAQQKQEMENIKFVQGQQKHCEEKYASEFQGTGYHWFGGPSNYTMKDVKITYSEKKKACIEEYEFQSGEKKDGEFKHSTNIEIKNLDNGVTYFSCTENNEGAKCSIGCKEKNLKSCILGNYSEDEKNKPFSKIAESDHMRILRDLGLVSEEYIEQLSSFDSLINGEN